MVSGVILDVIQPPVAKEACIPWLVGVVDGGGGKLFERCCIRNHLVLALVATRFQLPFLCLSASTS